MKPATYMLTLIFSLYILKEIFEYAVLYLNIRHMRKYGSEIPPEFEGKTDKELLKKTLDYEHEKARLGIVSSLFGNVILILFVFGGLLDIYNSWIASLDLSFVLSGWLFFMLLSYAGDFISVPFSLYGTFRIENRYGFNTMTFGLWINDFIKSFIISTILTSILIFAALWLISWSPGYWWLFVWLLLFVYGIFVMYISPYVIEPLFNKFAPLDDEILKGRIITLTEKAGIHLSRILKIDASRRSRHTNAYFTGIGRTKRIVLFDTLLEGMNHDEIISVLAHEIGHWKKMHLLKMMAAFELFSLIGLYISFRVVQSDLLLTVFHIGTDTMFVRFVLLGFLGDILLLPLGPVAAAFSRRHEREADRTSYELSGNNESMVSALIKLSKENLSNLYPHPLYVFLYYSHPPILERIRYIRGFGKNGT